MGKREIFLFLALILLINNIILISSQTNNSNAPIINVNNVSSIFEEADNKLDENFVIPEGLENFFKIFLGIENQVSLSQLIIIFCLWIFLFVIMGIFLSEGDLFGSKLICWGISFVVVCLIGVSKGLLEGTKILIGIFDVGFLAKWTMWQIFFIIVFLGILFGLFKFFDDKFRKSSRIESAKITGIEAGAGIKMIREEYKKYK